MSARVTVWYDGGCPLCVREIALMSRLDKHDRIHFIDIDREDASCPVDRDLLLRRLHAREGDDGPLVDGAAGFAAMWRAIPLLFLVVRPALQRFAVMLFGKGGEKGRSAN